MLELAASLLTPVAGAITYPITDDHPAIDIACRNGAEVRAAHDGVGRSSWDRRMGWTFKLAGGSGLKSSYSHLKTAAKQGHYKRGDVIGLCGNTGTWSTGTHLHFAMEPVSKLRQFHAFAPPITDQAPPSPSRPSLLAAIEDLGIKVDRLERCGAANQLAVYHRGAQRLCIAKALDSNPKLLEKVVTHEAVHITQDCLTGLHTPTSASLANHLKQHGGFSDATISKFFQKNINNTRQVDVATASLSPEESQMELEAYALQNQGPLVAALLNSRCSRPKG